MKLWDYRKEIAHMSMNNHVDVSVAVSQFLNNVHHVDDNGYAMADGMDLKLARTLKPHYAELNAQHDEFMAAYRKAGNLN